MILYKTNWYELLKHKCMIEDMILAPISNPNRRETTITAFSFSTRPTHFRSESVTERQKIVPLDKHVTSNIRKSWARKDLRTCKWLKMRYFKDNCSLINNARGQWQLVDCSKVGNIDALDFLSPNRENNQDLGQLLPVSHSFDQWRLRGLPFSASVLLEQYIAEEEIAKRWQYL